MFLRCTLLLVGPLGGACTNDGADDAPDALDAHDADGDGFAASSDCDDEDARVHPDAHEQCNAIDDDCDGDVDEGVLLSFYVDADHDGYGSDGDMIEACSMIEGVADNRYDCDDSDPDVHPNAPEVCANGKDEDCDGQDLDELYTWYADADGDGFGDPATTTEWCDAPTGFIADASDCDDGDPAVHPGVDERCDNAIDDDCDDVVASSADEDADGWYAGECVGGFDCHDGDATIHPSADETCDDEIDSDCNGFDCWPAGVVAAWYFEGDAHDASGNGNDGTVQGAELTSDRNGVPDAAFQFDGVSAYIDVPTSDSLDSVEKVEAVTVAAWIYVDDLDSNGFMIIEKDHPNSGTECWEYFLWTSDVMVLSTTESWGPVVPYTIAFDQWLFVAVTYDQTLGEASFYADGKLIDTVAYSESFISTDGGSVHIGWGACGGSEYSAGAIDDLYVFASALSGDEIAALYAM